MGRETNIAWTNSTLNLAWGCTKVTRECTYCYMFKLSKQFGRDPTKVMLTNAGRMPHRMEAAIRKCGNLIFVNSMSDTFHKDISDETLDDWFTIFKQHPEKQFQILTKRPERARDYFTKRSVPTNCWIGTSVGIKEAKSRIDILRDIWADRRFISAEPVLEDLGELNLYDIDWIIIGGESGINPRPMKPEWAENIVSQARHWGTKVFFKQMGGKGGDGAGGDLLNGRQIKEFPTVHDGSSGSSPSGLQEGSSLIQSS